MSIHYNRKLKGNRPNKINNRDFIKKKRQEKVNFLPFKIIILKYLVNYLCDFYYLSLLLNPLNSLN